ncbi:MAG: hypothetical protein M0R74_19685 [Dehalococcoidia bacterium]|jgi:oligoribonuclease NrnB/cAMP/cGMP phosphodiesterase (DHH superfamily)|nr:hypothetical protein [Dehalococcoidia bacterium]
MKCFYHNADLDGHCSAAIVKRREPRAYLIGINYGQPFPWERLELGEVVYMVDFSLQPFDEMVRLARSCRLVWIDHHKSAIEEEERHAPDLPSRIDGLRRDGMAGCELAWEYFYPGQEAPRAVRLLGRYDVWDLADPDVLRFQYGMRLLNTWPDQAPTLWDNLLATDTLRERSLVRGLIRDGAVILDYAAEENRKYCQAAAFETELAGLKCIAVNKMLTNSLLFNPVWDPERYHAMLAFGWRDGRWVVSLYSTREDVDRGAICKARGGGGHKGAAGFQCDTETIQGLLSARVG